MTTIIPCPNEDDLPFNEVVEGSLDTGQKLTATFQPEQNSTTMVLPIVAISKFPGFEYTVSVDDEVVYGPTTIPPTDVDDLQVTFIPAHQFHQEVKVVAKNVASSNGRDVAIQVMGWEVT